MCVSQWKEKIFFSHRQFKLSMLLLFSSYYLPPQNHSKCYSPGGLAMKHKIRWSIILCTLAHSSNHLQEFTCWIKNMYLPKWIENLYPDPPKCTCMFRAALLISAKTWKQPECPSVSKWINKLVYPYKKYYSAPKRNALSSYEWHGATLNMHY